MGQMPPGSPSSSRATPGWSANLHWCRGCGLPWEMGSATWWLLPSSPSCTSLREACSSHRGLTQSHKRLGQKDPMVTFDHAPPNNFSK